MLGPSPLALHRVLARPFTFRRNLTEIPGVLVFFRGIRAGELVNSETQANAFAVIDPTLIRAAGIQYLLKFDRLVSDIGESYTVQDARVSFDASEPVFFKAFVMGGGAS